MLNTLGSLSAAKSTGVLDCVTYTAGVSGALLLWRKFRALISNMVNLGSCWALGILYSGVAGSVLPKDAAKHAKDRIATSYVDMETLDALINPPTNKVLLARLCARNDKS